MPHIGRGPVFSGFLFDATRHDTVSMHDGAYLFFD